MKEMNLVKHMLRHIEHEPLSPEEEIRLLKAAKRGRRKERDRLVEANQRFVVRLAIYYRNQGLSIPDLIQEGNLGLIEAIDRYDFSKNCRLISYAAWWIRLYIQRAIEQKSRTVSIPINKVATLKKIRNYEFTYMKANGKKPSFQEIGEAMGLPADKVETIYHLGTSTVSIHAEDEDGQSIEDCFPVDDTEQLHQQIWVDQLRQRLDEAMTQLTSKERAVLSCRYGLEPDQDALSLRQAGKKLGLSAEGVRQIQAQAIDKLRNPEHPNGALQAFQ